MRGEINMSIIFAHRGASSDAPENTLPAFQMAIEQGCKAIELDVHLSRMRNLLYVTMKLSTGQQTERDILGTKHYSLFSKEMLAYGFPIILKGQEFRN